MLGLTYIKNFLTPTEQDDLLEFINAQKWDTTKNAALRISLCIFDKRHSRESRENTCRIRDSR
jgi:hypothetical protein